jgi:Concanavalin A-like lectin/glucanases superfamily/TGF-beta propeptide
MTYPLKGLVLHLHAALANNGRSQGDNSIPVSSWFDLTYKGHDAVLTNFNLGMDKGWVGKNQPNDPYALYFNGTSNHAVVNANTFHELRPTDAGFTIEVWVNPVNTGYVLSFGREGEQGFHLYYDQATSELKARVTTPTKQLFFNFSNVPFRQWGHYTLVYDGARLWGIYNGAPQGFSLPTNDTYSYTGYSLTIGRACWGNYDYFTGSVSVVRIYDRALDFEEVSNCLESGYLIEDEVSDLRGNGLVLFRDDLESSLNVSIMSKMSAKYDLIKNRTADLTSTLSVKEFSELPGDVSVRPVFRLESRYDIIGSSFSDLGGEISVTRYNDLVSSVGVNPSAYMKAKYDTEVIPYDDLPSSLEVYDYPENLRSFITVGIPETKVTAKYSTHKAFYNDLGGSISVTHTNDLSSLLQVNATTWMRAEYDIQGVVVNDLYSELFVRSTHHLQGSLAVNTRAFVRGRYGIQGIYINDLPSTLIVPSTNDLVSTINIPIKSRMVSRYDVSPIYLEDLQSELGIKEFNELYGEMFINFETKLRSRYEVTPIYFDWLPSEITVNAVSELQSSVFVMKPLVLRARYDLMERPNFTVKLYPVKDAFVREFFPKLNYGTEVQMYTGRAGSPFPERYRSFIGFDLSSIPKENTEIGKAILRLYYDGRGEGSQTVQVIEPTANWTETGITWANHPMPDMTSYDGFSVTADVGGGAGYVEFDVTPLVKAWFKNEKPNYGFLLKALDESTNLLRGFYTKEAIERRPELVVTYYDMQVYSDDYGYITADITVRQNKTKDLSSRLTVRQYWSWNNLPSNLKVHQPNELESIIWINFPQIKGSLKVRHKDFSNLSSSIAVRVLQVSELDSTISANEKEKPSSIYVLYREDVNSDITVRRWGDPWTDGGQLPSEIGVSEVNKDSHIYVLYRDDLDSELDVRVWSDDTDPQNNLLIEFEVTRRFELPGEINVSERVDLDSSLGIRVEGFTDQPSEMYILHRDDLSGSAVVGNPRLPSYIEVWAYSLLNGSGTVRRSDISDLPSTINIPLGGGSELPSTIKLRMMKDVPGTITVRSGNLQSFISIPINAQKDLLSVLSVRVRRASDLESILGIASGNFYSEISVRVSDYKDTQGTLKVRQSTDNNLPIEGYVRPWVNLFSYIAASKPRYRDLYGEFTVRQSDFSDLQGHIAVRVWNDPWTDGGQLSGSIAVRVWEEHDQPSSIAIRRDDKSDLGGYIEAKQVSDLSSDIAVRQFGTSDLLSDIACYEHNELYNTITVRRWGDPWTDGGQIQGTITVRQFGTSDLNGLVRVFEHYNVPSTIAVRRSDKSDLNGTISIRVVGYKDQQCSITVRQKDASDLWTYVFAVRRSDKSEVPGSASVKRVSNLYCTIEVVTAYPYAYIM